MSGTMAVSRMNVRFLLKDTGMSNPALHDFEIENYIRASADRLGNTLMLAEAWTNNAITLVAGTSDYTLSSSFEYASIVALRLDSQGWLLKRRSLDEVEFAREGPTETRGDPDEFYLWEDSSNLVNVRVFPTPWQSDTIDVFRSVLPTATTTEATVLPFSAPMLRVVEREAALNGLLSMPQQDRDRLRINVEVAPQWKDEIEKGIRMEQQRLWRLRRQGYVARVTP